MASNSATARTDQRANYPDSIRIALLEQDADRHGAENRAMFEKLDEIESRQNQIFVALVVGALGLAINIVVMLTIAGFVGE